MTQAYPFEWKVLNLAQSLSIRLAGERRGHQSFLMVLGIDGSVRTLQFECPEDNWHLLTKRLDRAGTAYLFYDPFDAAEHTWLSWRQIGRSPMERLIGQRFENVDFVKTQHASSRAVELEPANIFPASWGVMF
ncbi:MAG: hypothetical protein O7E49_09190 [Gemmatimonadetes bacterium]|nr:hypothetical protein [Gemmatimonadota bacterium]